MDKPVIEQVHPWRDCGHGQGQARAGLLLKGLWLRARPLWSRYMSESIVAHGEGHTRTGAPQSYCGCG